MMAELQIAGPAETFTRIATQVGAQVVSVASVAEAVGIVAEQVSGSLLLPTFPTASRFKLKAALGKAGIEVVNESLRSSGSRAEAGLTGVNFAIADTGTLVLDSTAEDIRLATTLPPKQFALLDPRKIVADGLRL